jgi:hypothetical protein
LREKEISRNPKHKEEFQPLEINFLFQACVLKTERRVSEDEDTLAKTAS